MSAWAEIRHACNHPLRRVNMKVIIALLFLAAVAVYAEEEMEYHPQAILNYLEMEDQEMARKVRGFLEPRVQVVPPTRKPRPRMPTTISPGVKKFNGFIFFKYSIKKFRLYSFL